MRILHVLHSFPPHSRGGVESYVQALVRAQRQAGDEALVLCGSEHGPTQPGFSEERVEGATVFRLRPPERGPLIDGGIGVDPAMRALVQRCLELVRPDVVHVHHWHNVTTDLVATVRARGIATVVTLHDLFAVCPLFFRLPDDVHPCPADVDVPTCARCVGRSAHEPQERLERAFGVRGARLRAELDASGSVLALSPEQAVYLRQVPLLHGLEISVAPPPPPEVPSPLARWQAEEGLRLVTWGGLVPGKGLHVLIGAAEGLVGPERVTIEHFGRVLDGHYRTRLQDAARRVRLALHGEYAREDLAQRFPAFDAAVFPSFFLETHGFTVDEALALGLPVIVSDRGAPAARVGARGLVFPAGDEHALRAILQRLLDDPTELARLRRGAPIAPVRMADHLSLLSRKYRQALVALSRERISEGHAPAP